MKTSDERVTSINNKVRKKRDRRLAAWTSSVAACVLIAVTVVCSLPILGENVPSINAYKNDEYYPLIQKINEQYQDNRYSIFEQLGSQINGMFGATSAGPPIDGSGPVVSPESPSDNSQGGEATGKYEETTLNQVDGVIEGDLLKRSTTHAFYLQDDRYSKQDDKSCLLLRAYSLAGNDSAMVDEYTIVAKDNTRFLIYGGSRAAEMFLNDNATHLTVIAPCSSEQNITYTTVISLDVSNPEAITEVNRMYVSGLYLSSRLVNGKLLVMTNFNVSSYSYGYEQTIDYDKKETYVPQCGSNLNVDFIPIEDIYLPNHCLNTSYTVFAMLDEMSLEVDDSYAVYSYSQDVYVSCDYIVLARNNRYFYGNSFDYGNEINEAKANAAVLSKQIMTCELVALKYADGFAKLGEIGVEGGIKDRYSMDEKDGVLRVFTTTRHKLNPFIWEEQSSLNVSLYCVDLATMKIVASKESFAPAGDEVKSVRFDGDKAYVCTARGVVDPVFYFDLSDLNNITYVDTGEIAGFSVNLIKFNDLLLGIGRGEGWYSLKVELYKESDDPEAENGVVSVCKYERYCDFSVQYKAHFVNAEQGLIGLQIYDYQDDVVTSAPNLNKHKYLLLHYDVETNTLEQIYLEFFDGRIDDVRAFYDHNGVYVFGDNDFTFISLQD